MEVAGRDKTHSSAQEEMVAALAGALDWKPEDSVSSSPGVAQAERVDPAGQIDFLDFDFSSLNPEDVLKLLADRRPDAPFTYVVTPNVDHIVRLQTRRSDLWPAYRAAWLRLCDSRVLVMLASLADVALTAVPGSDLTAELLQHVIRPDDPISIIGGDDASIDKLRQDYGLSNVIHHNPPMGFIRDPAALARAADVVIGSHARFVFLAVGSPQQELLAHYIARTGRATGLGLCVGASLQFLSGEQHRAPRWLQQLALEWLFRLGSNPKRLWRRYLVDGPLIVPIFQAWRGGRGAVPALRHAAPPHPRYRVGAPEIAGRQLRLNEAASSVTFPGNAG